VLGKNGLYWGTVEDVGPQDEPPLAADHISVRFGDTVHTLPPALWEGCQQGRPIEAPSSPIPGVTSSSRAAAAEQQQQSSSSSSVSAAGSQQQCLSSRVTAAVSQQQCLSSSVSAAVSQQQCLSSSVSAAGSQQRCQTMMFAGMSLEQYNAMMDQAPTMQADLDRVERDMVSELIV
jgi:hypothetical protein